MIEVNINLPTGYYLDYFGYLFPWDPESGVYSVSSTTDIGKLLIAYAKISDKPVQTAGGGKSTQTVTLSLPLTSTSIGWSSARCRKCPGNLSARQTISKNHSISLITRQGKEISARTKSRSGNLVSGRSVTTTDDRLSFTHPIYERFLDMKVRGRKRRKIHNRFIFGTYATIADKLMNGIRERVADEFKAKIDTKR